MKRLVVSVIIPCRNEERYIEKCLLSILENDYPKDQLEVLVVNGMSTDRTRKIVEEFVCQYPYMKLLDNPKKIIPCAMNIGIRESRGEVIMKMDAHATYPRDYISKCVRALQEYGADNVGGVVRAMPGASTAVARAIAECLSHSFGVGTSPFRRARAFKVPRKVDTVAFGCYNRAIFEKIGLYNENLVRSSDMELNCRLRRANGKILLVSDMVVDYYVDPDLRSFIKHTWSDGIWATYPFRFTKRLLRPRHLVPLGWLMLLISFPPLIVLYGAGILTSAMEIAWRKRDPRYLFWMPLVFAIRHVVYGFGSLLGLVRVVSQL